MTPSRSAARRGSFVANCTYGHTCAEESRSHMASMSPVMTNVSGLPSSVSGKTVVSRVLGKHRSNIMLSMGSAICCFMRVMTASMAGLEKRRSEGLGRPAERSGADAARDRGRAAAAPMAMHPCRTDRRVNWSKKYLSVLFCPGVEHLNGVPQNAGRAAEVA
jgi:hypothetical protein